MFYFTSEVTGMTYDDIQKIIGKAGDLSGSTDEEEEASRYLSDDGRIVSVTYGDKNADGSYSAYKTFILNYNNFSVNVEYGDVTYTIPAYGYVVVMH
jgi:polyribonucleotide nucleotidyltransferase